MALSLPPVELPVASGPAPALPALPSQPWVAPPQSADTLEQAIPVASAPVTLPSIREPLLKRPFDVALASIMLVISAPIWALIALAITLEDGGPVFFRQERWGRGQTRFQVLKFRSMVIDADLRQATVRDKRVTRTGRFLRATGLDELPQLVNILHGDMSFVGPRALATQERSQDGSHMTYEDTPGFGRRLLVRPGLTGLATIYLPKDASSRLKFRTDQLYVTRISFWLDVRLVLLSFWISFRGKWETRSNKV